MPPVTLSQNPATVDPHDLRPSPVERWIPALLVVLTLAVLWPLLVGEFTTWDDYRAIVRVPWLNPPGIAHFAEFWNPCHPFMDIWIPLTYTVWSAVAAIAYVPTPDPDTGAFLNPWIFHGANLLVHIGSVLVVYVILKRLVGRAWPAAAGAALFAIHPLQVEPVGWLSGMKDLLAGLMGLIAIWQYIQFALPQDALSPNPPRSGWTAGPPLRQDQRATNPLKQDETPSASQHSLHYALATTAFILAMLAKPSGVVIPLLVGAIDLFLLRRPTRKVATALLPWLILTVPIVIEGRFAQPVQHVQATPLMLRPLIAADALAFYLYKLAFPLRLAIDYGRTPHAALSHHWPYYTWIAPAAVFLAAWVFRKRYPSLTAAVGVYWLAALPVLGLVPFDFQAYSTVADHYLYLAMLGPAILLAFVLHAARNRAAVIIACSLLALFGFRAFRQTWTWHDSMSLYANAIAENPRSCHSYTNLADAYRSKRDYPNALATFERGLDNTPDCLALRVGYASVLAQTDRYDEAERQYEIAAQTATGDYARVIAESLTRLNKIRSSTATMPASRPHLTPAPSPIK